MEEFSPHLSTDSGLRLRLSVFQISHYLCTVRSSTFGFAVSVFLILLSIYANRIIFGLFHGPPSSPFFPFFYSLLLYLYSTCLLHRFPSYFVIVFNSYSPPPLPHLCISHRLSRLLLFLFLFLLLFLLLSFSVSMYYLVTERAMLSPSSKKIDPCNTDQLFATFRFKRLQRLTNKEQSQDRGGILALVHLFKFLFRILSESNSQ